MKHFIFIAILFTPIGLVAQQIECLDTVTISGYFFKIKNNSIAPEAFTSSDKYFYFSPVYDIKSKGIFKIMDDWQKEEKDTVKYLSYKPTKDISMYTIASCQNRIDEVINIQPFTAENKLYKIKGYKKRQILMSYAKVRWLHLKVTKQVACGEGLDRPASLSCDLSKHRYFDIYLPLKLLEIDNSIQLKNNKIIFSVHPH